VGPPSAALPHVATAWLQSRGRGSPHRSLHRFGLGRQTAAAQLPSIATRPSADAAPRAALAAALPLFAAARHASAQQGGDDVRIEVSTLRNATGTLNCRLFAEPGSFPVGGGVKTVRASINGAKTTCAFEDVAPGTYAVAVVHDENANGRLDKNLFGVPTEGYGVSNNHTYALSAPKWGESRFTVAAGEPATLRVSLRY
jgi:uncharacterized protein (DUF2141 family)